MLTKQTVSKLQKFGAREKQIVLQLLVHSGVKYTKNSSGYMFNVKDIPPELLSRVNETVTAISKDKADVDDTELKREELLKEYVRLNELGARESLLKERQLFLNSITDTQGDGSNITFSMERVVKYTKTPATNTNTNTTTSGDLVSNCRLPKTGLWSRILKKRFNHSQRKIDVDSVETTQAIEEGNDEFYNEDLMIDTDGDGGKYTIGDDNDNDEIDSCIPELPELKKIKIAEDETEDKTEDDEVEDDEDEVENVIRDTPFMNDVIKELEELGYIFKAGGLLVFEDYIQPTRSASISVT